MSLFIGLLAGIFGGLAGLGGGAVMVPLMVRFHKLGQHQAHGTSLMVLIFTGLAGAATYALKGKVDLMAAVFLAASAILTAWLGASYANALPEWKLKRYFGIFLIFVSLVLLFKPYISQASHPATGWAKIVWLLASGAAAGFLSGMMGVGGGAIMVAGLVLLVGLSQYSAQGSSLLAMVPSGAVGAFTYWRLGKVETSILPGLIPGIIVGTYLGGTLALHLPENTLRVIFAILVLWLGIRDIKGSIRKKQETELPLKEAPLD